MTLERSQLDLVSIPGDYVRASPSKSCLTDPHRGPSFTLVSININLAEDSKYFILLLANGRNISRLRVLFLQALKRESVMV